MLIFSIKGARDNAPRLGRSQKITGCIMGINIAPGERGGAASIIAHTNDLIHSAVRLSFEYRTDEEASYEQNALPDIP